MKKTVLNTKLSIITILLIFGISSNVNAQENLVSIGLGYNYFAAEGGALHFIPAEISYQRAISDNISIGIGTTYAIGLNKVGNSNTSINSFTPKFDYFFNSTFKGLHIGSNVSLNNYIVSTESNGVSYSASQLGATLGARLGYSFRLSTNWVADIAVNPGYEVLFQSGSKGNFASKTLFTLGYNF